MINQIVIGCRLGHEPELKDANGTAVLKLRVANDIRAYVDGKWDTHTNWLDVTMFGKRAEGIAPYLSKGDKIQVAGKLKTREYTAKDGSKRTGFEIIAEDIDPFFDRRGDGEATFPRARQSESVYSDEIPF